jgi:succinyl-diaminopimelate desuccinylase
MDSDDILAASKQLMAIPSVAGDARALGQAIDFIAGMLENVPGITIERFLGNKPSLLAYKGAVRPKKFAVILHGHLDVVPGAPEQFTAEVRDGKLYGRGAQDMKIAALIMADVFRRTVNTVPYALGLQMVTDEEIGGAEGAVHHIRSGLRTEFAITGEHNFHDNVIYNAARGICWVEVEFTGQTAHGAYVWKGVNAISKAATFAHLLSQHYPRPSEETWTTTASVASIHTANTTFNKIPDHAVVKIDFRFTPDDPVFKSRESVEAFVRSISPEAKVTAFATMEPAVYVKKDNPYLQILADSLTSVIGEPVRFDSRPAASDGRHYAAEGMDVVEYGLTGNGPHSDHEHIELQSIPKYAATLQTFLTSPRLAAIAGKGTGIHENTPGSSAAHKARRARNSQRKILAKQPSA